MVWFGRNKAAISHYRALAAHYGSAGQMNHQIHVSTGHRFIYFSNPKVACSSTKASLNAAVAERAGLRFSLRSMNEIHDRSANPLETPVQVGIEAFDRMMADPDTTRFTFTRDPVMRFLSAYLSKLHPSKKGSPIARRLLAHLGRTPQNHLRLEEFAALCASDPVIRDFDPHWRLQRSQIAYDLVDFSFIGDHAHFATDFAALSRRLFDGEEVPVFDTRVAFGRFTEAKAAAQDVSPALRRDIETAYTADYEMLEDIRTRDLRPRTG